MLSAKLSEVNNAARYDESRGVYRDARYDSAPVVTSSCKSWWGTGAGAEYYNSLLQENRKNSSDAARQECGAPPSSRSIGSRGSTYMVERKPENSPRFWTPGVNS